MKYYIAFCLRQPRAEDCFWNTLPFHYYLGIVWGHTKMLGSIAWERWRTKFVDKLEFTMGEFKADIEGLSVRDNDIETS